MKRTIATVFHSTFIFNSALAIETKCQDKKMVYKICQDQMQSFKKALNLANKQEKQILIKFGANWCPWCISLHHTFKNELASFVKKNFILIEIPLYKGKEKIKEAQAVIDLISKSSNNRPEKIGLPLLAIVDPKKLKTVFRDTAKLEHNTEHKKSHYPKKIEEALLLDLKQF